MPAKKGARSARTTRANGTQRAAAKRDMRRHKAGSIEKTIESLKAEVRAKIKKGEQIDPTAEDQNLAGREVQVRIAQLEVKAAAERKNGDIAKRGHKIKRQVEQIKQQIDPEG